MFRQTFPSILIACIFVMTGFAATAQKELSGSSEFGQPGLIDSTTVLNEIKISRELQKRNPEDSNDYVHAKEAINYALVLKDTLLYARALDNLGLLYRHNQEYSQSLDLHIKAFELIKNMPVAPIFKMIFANNAGVSARYFEKYDLAVQYYLDALKIAEKENDLKNIAISSNGLGNVLGNISGRQEESLAYFNRALEVEKSRHNPRGVAMNFLSISDYYIQKKDYEIARDYLEKLKDLNRTNKDNHGLAITDEFYGISFLEEGKELGKALSYFKTSLHRFEEINDLQKQAEILSRIGSVYEKQGKTSEALINYNKSMSLAKTINSKGLILSNAENIGSVYEKRNDFEKALQYYKLAQLYRDSIDLFQQKIQIAAVTNNYEIAKKESRIKILENEKRLRQEQLSAQKEKTKRQAVLFLLIGIVILAVLAISIMQNRNIKLKKKSELLFAAKEKERLKALYERDLAQAQMQASRLQLNPHFLFNCLNGINFLIQKEENEKAANYLVVFSRFLRLVLETSKAP